MTLGYKFGGAEDAAFFDKNEGNLVIRYQLTAHDADVFFVPVPFPKQTAFDDDGTVAVIKLRYACYLARHER